MNDLLIKALNFENNSRAPIWLMRQAGRYLPRYQNLKTVYSFETMYKTPEIAAPITLMPIEDLNIDAAILFSDILVITETLGKKFHFQPKPILKDPIKTKSEITNLPSLNTKEKLNYVAQTIKIVKPHLKVPLIGFCGGPFTIASYLVEGQHNNKMPKTLKWIEKEPNSFLELLEKITEKSIEYLNLQIDAGVDIIQIFDTWAGMLSSEQFDKFALLFLKKILNKIKKAPIILFCLNSKSVAKKLALIKPAAISLDSNCDILKMRKEISNIALQGNLSPQTLLKSEKEIIKEANEIINKMKNDKGFIFNLGHGILKETPIDNVKLLINHIKTSRY